VYSFYAVEGTRTKLTRSNQWHNQTTPSCAVYAGCIETLELMNDNLSQNHWLHQCAQTADCSLSIFQSAETLTS